MTDLAEAALRRFAPAEIPSRFTAPANRLLRRRAPLVVTAAGAAVELRLTAASPPAADALWIAARLDGVALAVSAPLGLVRARAGAEVAAVADTALAALVMEARLAPWLDAFERATGHGAELLHGGGDAPEGTALGLEVRFPDGGLSRSHLVAEEAGLAALEAIVSGLPDLPADAASLPVALHLRLATATLALRELPTLGAGDIVLAATPPGEVWLVAGERLAAQVLLETDGAALRLLGPLRPMGPSERESWAMADAADGRTGNEAADLDELPVRLAFELGRLEVSLGELRRMGEGHVIALGRDPAAPVDIVANGRHIGQGELVRLDAGIGVRIVRLFGYA